MNERYAASPFGGEDEPWGVWDNAEEKWVNASGNAVSHGATPLECSENHAQGVARQLNENICALCGEQCGEAHANVRVGRVCESCADHRLDESGEVKDDPPQLLSKAIRTVMDFTAVATLQDAITTLEEFIREHLAEPAGCGVSTGAELFDARQALEIVKIHAKRDDGSVQFLRDKALEGIPVLSLPDPKHPGYFILHVLTPA